MAEPPIGLRATGDSVAEYRRHASEQAELSQIDYFLDQLARAVERGEVPLASYETLAPRYLERRADLVGILTGGVQAQPAVEAMQPAVVPTYREVPVEEWQAYAARSLPAGRSPAANAPAADPLATRPVASARESKPVPWTTVLLFAGAFLVIVASAIFAFWAWERFGPTTKLLALGGVTIGFYIAGWYTRRKLELRTGGGALTVVASTMLLFDWWILIDGFGLPTTTSWAGALLLTSLVYWASEVVLGDRFYGAAGAAAQVGWWWLMASGLHLEQSWRLVGIAVIALVWQLSAERARASDGFGSLATMLEWAAPVVEVLAAMSFVGNAMFIGHSSVSLAACGLIVSASGAVVTLRSRHLSDAVRFWVAGALQLPFFVVLVLPGHSTWTGAALLTAATVVYALYALLDGGAPFAIAAVLAEAITVASVLNLLHASNRVETGVFAALAVTWVAAARLADTMAGDSAFERWRGARAMSHVGVVAGIALLVLSTLAVPLTGAGVALSGAKIVAQDVQLASLVLACWAAASLIRRRPFFAAGAVLWSFYLLATVLAWSAHTLHSATYALLLLILVAVWHSTRRPLERFYGLPEELTAWTMRGLVLVIVAGGLFAEVTFFDTATSVQAIGLVALAITLFLADAVFSEPEASPILALLLSVLTVAMTIGGLADNVRLIAVVLAAWVAAAFARRTSLLTGGTVAWSFYALSALVAWRLPSLDSAVFATILLVLAGVWLSVRRQLDRHFALAEQFTGWAMRVGVLLLVFDGLAAEIFRVSSVSNWQALVLVSAASVLFFADAVLGGPGFSAALASGLAIGAADIGAHRAGASSGQIALVLGAASATLSVGGAAVRDLWERKAAMLAGAAAVVALLLAMPVMDTNWHVVIAVVLWAVAVAGAGYASRQQYLALLFGLTLLVALAIGLATANQAWPLTVAAIGLLSSALGAASFVPIGSRGGRLETSGRMLAIAGGMGLATLALWCFSVAQVGELGPAARWMDFSREGLVVALLLLGAYGVLQAVRWRIEAFEYAGWAVVLLAVFAQLWASDQTGRELFTTPIAAYAVGMGYLFARHHPESGVPVASDAAAVLIGLGMPVLATLRASQSGMFSHLAWSVGLSSLFVIAGIGLRVRWYLYGGVAAIVIATGWRTILYLAGLWWVILGLLGIAAILVALTWERQKLFVSDVALRTQSWR